MKASRFTEALKAFILSHVEGGTQVAEVCRKAGISERRSTIGARSTAG